MFNHGAFYSAESETCTFSVWAPEKEGITLEIVHPIRLNVPMAKDEEGYFKVTLENMPPGIRYYFKQESETRYPDPASAFQPEGVHGPSEVVDHGQFTWSDNEWKGIPFRDLIIYEIHIGTFTDEGTFEAIIPFLDDLCETGINAIELMPVCQFPGSRNWGYDGVYPYSVQNSYGGPKGLKKLVEACHKRGIAVFLDVVYNHMGPEGNYFSKFGPWFTDKYCTPWGNAMNFDGEWSDGVREFFSDNPLYWFRNYHIDGLRFDAIHTIFDSGAVNFWELLVGKVRNLEQELGRFLYLTAECDYNSPHVVKSPESRGLGFNAQWLDDFHHALYVLLDKKGKERYIDFGRIEQLAKAYTDGFVHSGEFVKARKRRHGTSSAGIPGDKFIVFNQNHDQVGNRVMGERLSVLVDFDRLKLAAAAIFVSPYIPMLFMGEEYGEDNPFFYFANHSEKSLMKAVREGRKKEFEGFKDSNAEPPDAFSETTFNRCKLEWNKRKENHHRILLEWHRELIRLRQSNPILQNAIKNDIRASAAFESSLVILRQRPDGKEFLLILFNFSDEPASFVYPLPATGGWSKLLDSREAKWMKDIDLKQNEQETPANFNHIEGNNIMLEPLSVVVFVSR